MRFLRGTILAIGFMSFAVACGGAKKDAAEPTPNSGEENPCAAGEAGGEENPCAAAEPGGEDPCAAAEAGGEDPCAE